MGNFSDAASLTALFKHVEIGMENVREKVICFLKDKVNSKFIWTRSCVEKSSILSKLKNICFWSGVPFKSRAAEAPS